MLSRLARIELGQFGLGLPALLGVMLGIRLFTGGQVWYICAVIAFFGLWATMCCGRFLMRTCPAGGALLIETWILGAVLVTALITAGITTITLDNWFPAFLGHAPTGIDPAKLSATLVGAVTAFSALVWTKDISDGKGYFWPSTQFKRGMAELYRRLSNDDAAPQGNSTEYSAIFLDNVVGVGEIGWSFAGRWARVGILKTYLDSKQLGGCQMFRRR